VYFFFAQMKSFPLFAVASLALLSVVHAQSPVPTSTDPIVGRWHWNGGHGDGIVVLSEDGKALKLTDKTKGRWTFEPPKGPGSEAERRYVVSWQDGLYISTVFLSSDGAHLHGGYHKLPKVGAKIHADRIAETVDAKK
jgi:hypothetical protein